MITFKSRKQLAQAEFIQRAAHNFYPHISSTALTTRIESLIPSESGMEKYMRVVSNAYNYSRKINSNLTKLREEIVKDPSVLYLNVIESLKKHKSGNCGEEAELAKLIGRLNGQSNIYTGKLWCNLNNTGLETPRNHEVAFITDIPVESGKKYFFKNKEAIIIDPWLGVTDFASSYFTKIKTILRERLRDIPNICHEMKTLRRKVATLEEFRARCKKEVTKTKFRIAPYMEVAVSARQMTLYKMMFPELVFKDFRPVEF